jgi:hypothetical protein
VAGYTTRLQLYKHDQGDLDWHTLLNTGFDNAEARFMLYGTTHADPNSGNVDGNFVGQVYIYFHAASDLHRIWICKTTGAGTSVWKLIDTRCIETDTAKESNTNLETILADYQTRISAIEDAIPVPPRGHIDGLGTTWSGAGQTIDFATGSCADFSKTRFIEPAAMTKDLDASWVAGDGNGGLSSSLTWTDTVWYHKFALYKISGSVADFGLDSSVSAANLINDHGFDYYRRIGSVLADSATTAARYIQVGDHYMWYTLPAEFNEDGLDEGAVGAVTVTLVTPPDVATLAHISLYIADVAHGGNPIHMYVSCPDQENQAVSETDGIVSMTMPGGEAASSASLLVRTNTSKQIRLRTDTNGIDTVRGSVYGWFDPRGRDL